jgi:hypothetical protein
MTVAAEAAYPHVKRSPMIFDKGTKNADYDMNRMIRNDPNGLLGFWDLY